MFFKIKFKDELSYKQFKEVSKFLEEEFSNSTLNAINGISFLFKGEQDIYTFKIKSEKIIISLEK